MFKEAIFLELSIVFHVILHVYSFLYQICLVPCVFSFVCADFFPPMTHSFLPGRRGYERTTCNGQTKIGILPLSQQMEYRTAMAISPPMKSGEKQREFSWFFWGGCSMIQFASSIAPLEDVNLSQVICVQCSDVMCDTHQIYRYI